MNLNFETKNVFQEHFLTQKLQPTPASFLFPPHSYSGTSCLKKYFITSFLGNPSAWNICGEDVQGGNMADNTFHGEDKFKTPSLELYNDTLRYIVLSEIKQLADKDKYHVISVICGI